MPRIGISENNSNSIKKMISQGNKEVPQFMILFTFPYYKFNTTIVISYF